MEVQQGRGGGGGGGEGRQQLGRGRHPDNNIGTPGQGVQVLLVVSKKEMPQGVQAGEEGRKGEKVAVRSLHQHIGRGDPFPGVLIFNIVEQGRLKTENLRRFSNVAGPQGRGGNGLAPMQEGSPLFEGCQCCGSRLS